MKRMTISGCQVDYHDDRVVLSGPHDALEHEARRILRRFASSGRPFYIAEQGNDQLVLRHQR